MRSLETTMIVVGSSAKLAGESDSRHPLIAAALSVLGR